MDGLTTHLRCIEEAVDLLTAAIGDLRDNARAAAPSGRDTAAPEHDGWWPDAARWAPPIEPQARVWVFWCPSCGRHFPVGHLPGPTHYRRLRYGRRRCEERPVELMYRLDEASYRATVATKPCERGRPALRLADGEDGSDA